MAGYFRYELHIPEMYHVFCDPRCGPPHGMKLYRKDDQVNRSRQTQQSLHSGNTSMIYHLARLLQTVSHIMKADDIRLFPNYTCRSYILHVQRIPRTALLLPEALASSVADAVHMCLLWLSGQFLLVCWWVSNCPPCQLHSGSSRQPAASSGGGCGSSSIGRAQYVCDV